MGDIQGADEKPTESVVESDEKNAEPGHLDNAPQESVVNFQHVIITLADGRRGVFMGPELIKEIEMKLNTVPKLVSIDFDPPRAVAMPVPRETVPVNDPVSDPVKEETPNADTKVDDAPAAGLV